MRRDRRAIAALTLVTLAGCGGGGDPEGVTSGPDVDAVRAQTKAFFEDLAAGRDRACRRLTQRTLSDVGTDESDCGLVRFAFGDLSKQVLPRIDDLDITVDGDAATITDETLSDPPLQARKGRDGWKLQFARER